MKTGKKILIFTGFYLPGFKGGGPIRTIANMVDALGDEVNFSLVTLDRDLGDAASYPDVIPDQWQQLGKAQVFYASSANAIYKTLEIIRNFQGDALHLNSFFSFRFSILPLLLSRISKPAMPVVIGPRGEFSQGALALKSLKKRLFIASAKFLGFYRHVVWHASSDYETADIRRVMGPDVKIRIAVDIALPGVDVSPAPRIMGVPLRVVFISRISHMKNLIGAIAMLQQVQTTVDFDIYGPTEDEAYWAECRAAAAALPANIKFQYRGSLPPVDVLNTLAQYDLFLLPTLGENFGHVIAEALSAGLPVLISDTTPWRDLAEKSIGWDIPLGQPERFAACIDECSTKPADEYNAWRKNIRAWAVQNIGNQDAIEQNRQLFMNLN